MGGIGRRDEAPAGARSRSESHQQLRFHCAHVVCHPNGEGAFVGGSWRQRERGLGARPHRAPAGGHERPFRRHREAADLCRRGRQGGRSNEGDGAPRRRSGQRCRDRSIASRGRPGPQCQRPARRLHAADSREQQRQSCRRAAVAGKGRRCECRHRRWIISEGEGRFDCARLFHSADDGVGLRVP